MNSKPARYYNGHVIISSTAVVLALATAMECESIVNNPASLLYGAVFWGFWACIASAIWELGKRVPLLPSFSTKVVLIYVLVGLALGTIHILLLEGFVFLNAGGSRQTLVSPWTSMFQLNRFGIEFLVYGFVLGITAMVQFQIRAQEEAMRSLELQRQLSAAHLSALQMQLEPHFLFNTLNAITTLVESGRQAVAAEMLAHLNALLKSTLTRTTPEKVLLSQELEFVENYLAIEQVRFADRLRVEMNVDPGAFDGLVPSFLLQPIVENAIRHGIANCEHDGLVQAWATRSGDQLHLRVRDSGPGLATPRQGGHGIGLKNTRERLEHFYQEGYTMSAAPLRTGGFEVSITIPYERSAEQAVMADLWSPALQR
jgi:sensor histidine kinase YesM